jgi:hypothetical protein
VAFGCGGRLPVPDGEPVQATFALEVNEWNGISEPRLVLRRAAAMSDVLAQQEAARAGVQAGVERLEDALEQSQTEELVLFALP